MASGNKERKSRGPVGEFLPARGLANGHLQTIWGPLFRRFPAPDWQREEITTPDGDFLSLYSSRARRDRPLVLLLHGLEGSRNSHYIRGFFQRISAEGWSAAALEFRGCGGRMNRRPRAYHSGDTGDIDHVVGELHRHHPSQPLFVVGFSLGGCALIKWLGERGTEAPITAAASVCPPFDLARGVHRLDTSLRGFYGRRFLRELLPKACRKLTQFPGLLDEARLARCRTIRGYDQLVTAPLHGFRGAMDYYERASCLPYVQAIRKPTLVLSSLDDPLIPTETIPRDLAERSPWVTQNLAEHGGHIGFIGPGGRYWAEDLVMDFLRRNATIPLHP